MRTSEYIKKYDLKNGFSVESHESFLMDFYFDFQSNVDIQKEIVSEFTESKFLDLVSTFRTKFESIFNKCPIAYPEHIWKKFVDDYVPVVLFDYFPDIRKQVEKIKDMDYISLYHYIFETLLMGNIIKESGGYIWIPKHICHDPDEDFLVSIIKICKEILEYELFYVEKISCERFLSWSENKLRHVLKINAEKEAKRKHYWEDEKFEDFFRFFWYENFKRKVFENVQKTIGIDASFKKLGIETTKDEDVIKKAYKQLAMKFHPDIVGNTKENHERMVEINEAKTKCLLFCKSI